MKYTVLIPAGGATALSPSYDGSQQGFLHPNCVAVIDTPALTTSQLPNGETITFQLLESNSPTLSTPISTTTLGVQTGAGGVGAAAVTFGGRLKYAGGRYWGIAAVASASANAAGVATIFNYATI